MIADTLALGTVQLGAIPNLPSEKEVERILKTAWDEGIRYYDTAQAYGVSEERLGRYLPAEAKIITKLHPAACDEPLDRIERRLEYSYAVLRQDCIYGLLLHRERMLDRWDEDLGELLVNWRQRGLVSDLGLSLESVDSDPHLIHRTCDLDILQVPMGVADPPSCTPHVFVRSLYRHGLVADRQKAIQEALEWLPTATLVIGAEMAVHVKDNCRMVERVCV